MSTAWYKSRSVPQRIRSWHNKKNQLTVEVWDTTCIVTNDFGPNYPLLINPANPQLTGVSKFPYFPVGGPQPPDGFQISKDAHPIMGYVSQWGGMSVGSGMMFAANVVDGLVHQLGSKELAAVCQEALRQPQPQQQRIQEGDAVATPAVGKLLSETNYKYIIHTIPPFYNHPPLPNDQDQDEDSIHALSKRLLAESYRSSLRIAATVSSNLDNDNGNGTICMASPLLGAGCRGFPVDVAIEVAAQTLMGDATSTQQVKQGGQLKQGSMTLGFGIPSGEIRERLMDALDCEYDKNINSNHNNNSNNDGKRERQ